MNGPSCDLCFRQQRQDNRIMPCLPDVLVLSYRCFNWGPNRVYDKWCQEALARRDAACRQLPQELLYKDIGHDYKVHYWPFAGRRHCGTQERQHAVLCTWLRSLL